MVGISIKVEYGKAKKKLAHAGKALDLPTLLKLIGMRHLYWINQNFERGGIEKKWAPLAGSTLANRRGGGRGAQILRDTGKLAQSFVIAYSANKVSVGTTNKTAIWHHFGTKPYIIKPKGGKVLVFRGAGGQAIFARTVRHPGLPERRLLPSKELGKQMAIEELNAYVEKLLKQE